MNFFETILLNLVFIMFPLLLYLFYVAYSQNIGKKERDIFLDCALVTSFYLVIRYGGSMFGECPYITFNIVLLIAYLKQRELTAILLSILSIGYYFTYLEFSFLFLIIEYLLYFILYLLLRSRNQMNYFLSISIVLKSCCFFFSILDTSYLGDQLSFKLIKVFIFMLVLFLIAQFVLLLFEKGSEIVKLHLTVKDLEQEKQIRDSLFKITHEIKNPIAVCKGYLDMFDVNNLEHSRKYIPILKEEIARTLILLKDFLAIKNVNIEKDILDINLLLEDVLHSFEPILKNKKCKMTLHLLDDEVYMDGDYNRLSQVFVNVLQNAVEALEEVENGSICVDTEIKNNLYQIVIADNGCGIKKEYLKRIEEPFFTTKKRGTGLGVSLSKEIIEAHDGVMRFESKEFEGTRVIISLPLKLD